MYTLLPMMQNVNDTMLLQVIDELIEYCKGDEAKLDRRLLWLSTFLRRAKVMPLLEKQRVQERLKMFDELLEQDEFVQKQRERGQQEGAVKYAQEVLVNYISIRYPSLIDLARQRAEKTSQQAVLQNILNMLFAAPDEATARFILTASSPVA